MQPYCRTSPIWTADPIKQDGEIAALKYYGHCLGASSRVKGEYQVVPMLTGLFWEVEHSAIYKPSPSLKGMERSPFMKEKNKAVLDALRRFEEEFEAEIRINRLMTNLLNYTPQQ